MAILKLKIMINLVDWVIDHYSRWKRPARVTGSVQVYGSERKTAKFGLVVTT